MIKSIKISLYHIGWACVRFGVWLWTSELIGHINGMNLITVLTRKKNKQREREKQKLHMKCHISTKFFWRNNGQLLYNLFIGNCSPLRFERVMGNNEISTQWFLMMIFIVNAISISFFFFFFVGWEIFDLLLWTP